jgi:MYXO-CTERM domain-containing protein
VPEDGGTNSNKGNGIDDDCDGLVDEEAECPGGSQCIEGACTLPCGTGEFVCPKGQICKDKWCVPDPCDAAACEGKGWVCKAGECIDPCKNVTCGKFEKCVKGACVDTSCYNPQNSCPDGQICVQGACENDPCKGVKCGDAEFCSDGKCVRICDTMVCGSGELCKVVQEGGKPVAKCVKDACADQQCNSPYVCIDGKCVEDPCLTTRCERGEVCVKGKCLADPCEKVDCPRGFRCVEGSCTNAGAVSQTTDMLASGSGGCACEVGRGASPPWPLWLLVGLALLWSRRRSRGGDA